MKYTLLLFSLLIYQVSFSQSVDQEVEISSGSISLKGTLLKPDANGTFPVALIISGSGPTDRDGNNPAMKNNSLKLLAEALAKNGIASLRYDKRGIAGSADSSITESELSFEDFIHDAEAWTDFLIARSDVDSITIIGHSEGSLIGMIAAQNGNVQRFVSLAGAGKPADKIIEEQINMQSPVLGQYATIIIDSINAGTTVREMPKPLEPLFRESVQPYLRSWFKYNPQTEIAKLRIPVLIAQGNTDIQVKVEDAELLHEAKPDAQLALIPGMNHVLKTVSEDRQANLKTYSDPSFPINPLVVSIISDFIKSK